MAGFEIRFEALDDASPTIQKLSAELLDAAQKSDRFAKEVTASTQKADQSLSTIPPKAKQTSESLGSLHSAAKELAGELLKFATVAGIAAFFKSSADAALDEERALQKLQFAVKATGNSFESSKERLTSFVNEQSQLTQFSNTQTVETLSRLVRVTGDLNTAMQGTRLVFGLASASGRDLNSVIDLLGPILTGDSTRLRALKTEFGAFIGDAKTAQQVVDNLSKVFIGAAETQTGYNKQISQLRNTLNQFQETVGAAVLPVFRFFLDSVVKGAEFFEILGTVIANFAAKVVVHFEGLTSKTVALFKFQFERLPQITQETANKIEAIEEASADQAADVHRKYHKEVVAQAVVATGIRVRKTQEVVIEEKKATDELRKLAAERLEAEARASSSRGEMERKDLQSRLILIEIEKATRIRSLEELKEKGLITEAELTKGRADATATSVALSKQAREAIDGDLLVIRGTQEAVAASLSSSFGRAVADIILEGKNLEQAMKEVFNTILRTAIETFTRIAVERAIISAGAEAATGGTGGGIISRFFGLQEGGIVQKPILANIGEAGPEAVIPLNRFQPAQAERAAPLNFSVTQNNNITISGTGINDEQIRLITKKISEATRSGAAEGAELIKSILAKQDRFQRVSV